MLRTVINQEDKNVKIIDSTYVDTLISVNAKITIVLQNNANSKFF